MSRVLYYPSPVSRAAMWRELFDAAEVTARRGPYMVGLPFASPGDVALAAAAIARREVRWGPIEDARKRQRSIAARARQVHRARLIIAAALRAGITHLAIWNGSGGRRRVLVEAARAAGLGLLFAELAPFPGKITLDPQGVNAAGSLPKNPDFYKDWAAATASRTDLATLRNGLVARAGKTRSSAGSVDLEHPFVFVPLQVRGDTQVMVHGGWIRGIPDFIAQVAAAAERLPAGWKVVFREHPSCHIGNAEQLAALVGDRIAVDNTTDTFELVRRSRGVVTLNSSVGLQSLLFDVPVLVLGDANYAIPDLVTRALDTGALQDAFATAESWSFDPDLRRAFLRFFIDEYLVDWPTSDAAARARTGAQVRARLTGRITEWTPD